MQISQVFQEYISQISKLYSTGQALELSYRTPLQNLLQAIITESNIAAHVNHEAKTQSSCRPDFVFTNSSLDIGFLEAKDIGEDLEKVLKSEQIAKYLALTNNLILTDYIRFIWIYKDLSSEVQDVQKSIVKDASLCDESDLSRKTIKLEGERIFEVKNLITSFANRKTAAITKIQPLAKAFSAPAAEVKQAIETRLEEEDRRRKEAGKQAKGKEVQNSSNQTSYNQTQLWGIYETFRDNLVKNLEIKEFADAFAQTLVYSLFIAKLENPIKQLTISNVHEYFPSSFGLIKGLTLFLSNLNKFPFLVPYINHLVYVVNNMDINSIAEHLQFHYDDEKDPYIYFYEDFLKEYDHKIKKDRGVYYTPPSVVTFIIRTVDEAIKHHFGYEDGFIATGVKTLDFATGTGTFLLEIYKQVLGTIPSNSPRKKTAFDHLLKNIFGFELMIAPYCIAHLKLAKFLESEGFCLEKMNRQEPKTLSTNRWDDDKYRIPVYLTNTLEGGTDNQGRFSFVEGLAEEAEAAQNIKKGNLFVIVGNPPYNAASMNDNAYIRELLTGKNAKGKKTGNGYYHIDGEPLGEKNPKWLQDDYVKFIRFAEEKISTNPNGGIIGIITPHNFLDNPTFRGMRHHLMKTFDAMYFIDLHGNARKKEATPTGEKDENVFDIMQGVCVSILIKQGGRAEKKHIKEAQVYTLDIYGKRQAKFNQLLEADIKDASKKNTPWQKVKPMAPFFLFKHQDEKKRKQYEKGWSMQEIFLEINVGIVTGKDQKTTALNIKELEQKIDSYFGDFHYQFVKDVCYRPFDVRKLYYDLETKGIIERGRKESMQHMLKDENVGLCFIRNDQGTTNYNHVFVSSTIADLHLIPIGTYLAPLYLYKESMGVLEKEVNFTQKFSTMVKKKFGFVEPEVVLGYIYAVLHSVDYRAKYLEFLKVDFPKIPFDVSVDVFHKLSSLGLLLIDLHLMKCVPKEPAFEKMGECLFADGHDKDADALLVKKVEYKASEKRVYINPVCWFENVSEEVFNFKIGGYVVLEKYLKSRKERHLSYKENKELGITDEVSHFQKVVKIIAKTIEVMAQISQINLEEGMANEPENEAEDA